MRVDEMVDAGLITPEQSSDIFEGVTFLELNQIEIDVKRLELLYLAGQKTGNRASLSDGQFQKVIASNPFTRGHPDDHESVEERFKRRMKLAADVKSRGVAQITDQSAAPDESIADIRARSAHKTGWFGRLLGRSGPGF